MRSIERKAKIQEWHTRWITPIKLHGLIWSYLIPDAGSQNAERALPKIPLTLYIMTQTLTGHGCFHCMARAAGPTLFVMPQHIGYCWTQFVWMPEAGRDEGWRTLAVWSSFDRRRYTRFTLWTRVFGPSYGSDREGYDSPSGWRIIQRVL